jgi:hypothetical protein
MTSGTLGRSSIGPVNFDSPSASVALGALDIGSVPDTGLESLGISTLNSDDDRARRLDSVIAILSVRLGLYHVSRRG